jgi:hypothetical protein
MHRLATRALVVVALLGAATAGAGGGETDWREPVTLAGFDAAAIVIRADLDASPPTAALTLENAAGATVYRFPPLPGTGAYAYFATRDLALTDIDGDGKDDVVVIVEVMTGIGPGGAEPFPLAGVYLQRDGDFAPATALDERLNGEPVYGRWSDLRSLLDQIAAVPDLPR